MQLKQFFIQVDSLDKKLISAIALKRNSFATIVFKIFTESARGYLWVFYVLALNYLIWSNIILFPYQIHLLQAMFAPLLAWFFGKLVKLIFKRKRPIQAIPGLVAKTHSPMNDSFPSLHAASSSSFATVLIFMHYPHAEVFALWSVFVTCSRLYLGVHYLSDLLGGLLIGILSGTFIFIFLG